MKISTLLDHIDNGSMALPEFQRGYVWNRDQVRGLMDSLYRRHPVGSLLVWDTASEGATHRGDAPIAPGRVKLLLDGQQRITSLYGIIRGRAPRFFDGNAQAFTGLFFNLDSEEFSFYLPLKMKNDPLWIDITRLMQEGPGPFIQDLSQRPEYLTQISLYLNRLSAIINIKEIDLHMEEITGQDKTIDVVVEIFNKVNSGGTKLSKGDLALAKVCAEWPEARETMKDALARWRRADYHFTLDWLLRNVNTIATGEALFSALHDVPSEQFRDGLKRAVKICDQLLNLVADRLGLDHDRVLFGRYAFPVMAHYLDRCGHKLATRERDRLLFWYLHSAMWGRFSGSTESVINQDLQKLEDLEGGLDRLIEGLRLWRGDLTVRPAHFSGWSLGARFYPVLYLLTRVGESRDWGSGLQIRQGLLGKHSRLHVHHIFPKARLYDHGYDRAEVNAVANFCFLFQDTNLDISDTLPAVYFPRIAKEHPGALESQWIPMDPELWKVENYPAFLEARRTLLAEAVNRLLAELAHEEAPAAQPVSVEQPEGPAAVEVMGAMVPGGIEDEAEEQLVLGCNAWVVEQGLPEGLYEYELADRVSGEPLAILDLAWPDGLQPGLSEPVALLIEESLETLNIAQSAGFRCFTALVTFRHYVQREILAVAEGEQQTRDHD